MSTDASLEVLIQDEIKTAMKAKDREKLEALRSIKSAIMLAKTEKGARTELGRDDEVKLLQRLLKQRKEAASIFTEQGREDLAAVEQQQSEIIQSFLPEAMDEAQLRLLIQAVIEQVGATSQRDMGKVMGPANARIAGRAEGKKIAQIVRELLS
jgi:uncharacterized protein YqeY